MQCVVLTKEVTTELADTKAKLMGFILGPGQPRRWCQEVACWCLWGLIWEDGFPVKSASLSELHPHLHYIKHIFWAWVSALRSLAFFGN